MARRYLRGSTPLVDCSSVGIGRLGLRQVVRPLLEGRLDEVGWSPQVGSQVPVGEAQRFKCCLHEVGFGTTVAARGCEAVCDTCHGEHLLHCWRADNATTTRCWDETDPDGSTLACNLHGNCVGRADTVTPVASAYRNQIDLCRNNPTANCRCHFLSALVSKTNVSIL